MAPQSPYKWFFETTTAVEGHAHAIIRTVFALRTEFQLMEILETASYGKVLVLDGRIQSAPTIETRIDREGRITGNFTTQEAADLSLVLRSGALPASLSYQEERQVGPSLGQDSIRAGVAASLTGLSLVTLYMLVYYRLAGINAFVSIALNLIILMGFMAYLGAVMGPAPNGWTGAAICLVAVFLPSMLLVIGALPFWEDLRRQPLAQAALRGVNAAVVGLLLAALYHPVWTAGILSAKDYALAAAAFLLLFMWQTPPWLVVVLCALGGAALAAF